MATPRPKRIAFSTDDPIFEAFLDFAAAAYPDQAPGAAVREACLVYTGTDPMEAARTAARRAAYLEARIEMNAIMNRFYRLLVKVTDRRLDDAYRELAEMEAAGQVVRAPERAA
jgi:hypothetical protein